MFAPPVESPLPTLHLFWSDELDWSYFSHASADAGEPENTLADFIGGVAENEPSEDGRRVGKYKDARCFSLEKPTP